MSKTINMAPSWATAARIYIEVLKTSNNAEALDAAEEDMMRLARSFDETQSDEYKAAMNAVLHAADDYLNTVVDDLTDEEAAGLLLSIKYLQGGSK